MKQDFLDVLEELNRAKVEYLIVGAQAMVVFGYARATGGIAIFVRPTSENSQRIWDALSAFGAPLGAHGIDSAFFASTGSIYQLGVPPSRIDILTEISGVSFEEAQSKSVTVKIGELQVISLANLICNKEASGREKGLLDAKELRARRGS